MMKNFLLHFRRILSYADNLHLSFICLFFAQTFLVCAHLFPWTWKQQHSPFVIVAVVEHLHGDADHTGDEDQQKQSTTHWSNYDNCVSLRKRFWHKTHLQWQFEWLCLYKNSQQARRVQYHYCRNFCHLAARCLTTQQKHHFQY